MRGVLISAAKQGVAILAIAVALSLGVNQARNDGVPLVAGAETFRVRTDAEFMKTEDAYRLFEEGAVIFLDAREPEIFATGHIEGAMNTPASSGDVESIAWLADTDAHIICYASKKNQRQAGVVADQLLQIGCKEVRILYGGIEGWIDQGLPTEAGG